MHQVFQNHVHLTCILTKINGDCGGDSSEAVAKCKLGIRQEQRNKADKEMCAK